MAITCNITDTFGATTPANAYTNETSRDGSVATFKTLDEAGRIVCLRPGKFKNYDVTISGGGDPDFGVVTAGDFTPGQFKALSATKEEFNTGEIQKFTITGKIKGVAA